MSLVVLQVRSRSSFGAGSPSPLEGQMSSSYNKQTSSSKYVKVASFSSQHNPLPRVGFSVSTCSSTNVVALVGGMMPDSRTDLRDVWSLNRGPDGTVWTDCGVSKVAALAQTSESGKGPLWREEISQTVTSTSLTPRHDHCAVLFDNLDLVVVGGTGCVASNPCNYSCDVHITNILLAEPGGFRPACVPAKAGTRRIRNSPTGGRAGSCSGLLHGRWIVLIGGMKPATGETVSAVHALDCGPPPPPCSQRKCSWLADSTLPQLPMALAHAASAVTKDGTALWIFGGKLANGDVSDQLMMLDTEVVSGAIGSKGLGWKKVQCVGGISSAPSARYGHGMMRFVSDDGRLLLLVAGGRRKPTKALPLPPTLSDVYVFDVDKSSWDFCPKLCEAEATLVVPRFCPGLCALPTNGGRSKYALLLWGAGDVATSIGEPAMLRLPRGGNGYVCAEPTSRSLVQHAADAAPPSGPQFSIKIERTAFYETSTTPPRPLLEHRVKSTKLSLALPVLQSIASIAKLHLLRLYMQRWTERQTDALQSSSSAKCHNCDAAPVECSLLPCRHATLCSSCANAVFVCPLCDAAIEACEATIVPRLRFLHRALVARANELPAGGCSGSLGNPSLKSPAGASLSESPPRASITRASSASRGTSSPIGTADVCSRVPRPGSGASTMSQEVIVRLAARRSLYVKSPLTM